MLVALIAYCDVGFVDQRLASPARAFHYSEDENAIKEENGKAAPSKNLLSSSLRRLRLILGRLRLSLAWRRTSRKCLCNHGCGSGRYSFARLAQKPSPNSRPAPRPLPTLRFHQVNESRRSRSSLPRSKAQCVQETSCHLNPTGLSHLALRSGQTLAATGHEATPTSDIR